MNGIGFASVIKTNFGEGSHYTDSDNGRIGKMTNYKKMAQIWQAFLTLVTGSFTFDFVCMYVYLSDPYSWLLCFIFFIIFLS